MARKFFYIAAGMLMLSLSYHFGARDAAGQAAAAIEATDYDNGALFAVVNGSWVQFNVGSGTVFPAYPLPVSAPVVGTGSSLVVYQNGDVYVYEGSPGEWVLKGNLSGGPTPTQKATWGQVKARYAPTPGESRLGSTDR